jgi:CRP-like cAMP-binding protein
VTLAQRQELIEPNKQIPHVYFIETGIAAVLAVSRKVRIAIGLIGSEGATGIPVFLGDTISPHSIVMITDGRGYRVSADDLRLQLELPSHLQKILLRYSLAFYNQAAHTALSNALTQVEQRIARWVLMTHDRVLADEVPLTHDVIAYMLGIRRAGATEALDRLQAQNVIAVERGFISVRNRKELERIAGASYGLPEREYDRLVGVSLPGGI